MKQRKTESKKENQNVQYAMGEMKREGPAAVKVTAINTQVITGKTLLYHYA